MTKRIWAALCAAGFATSVLAAAPAAADMKQWDADQDETVDREEFGEGWRGTDEEMDEAFAEYDENKDDVLDIEEWSNYEDDREKGMWDQSGHRDAMGGASDG